MKINLLIICFLFLNNSQQDDEFQVLRTILNKIEFNSDKHILQCKKGKVSFSKEDYDEEGAKFPKEILNELEKASIDINKKYLGEWCTPCISFSKRKKEQKKSLVIVSNPIFDSNKEYCVITVTIRKKNSAMGMTYILKKNENEWNIIDILDIWIT